MTSGQGSASDAAVEELFLDLPTGVEIEVVDGESQGDETPVVDRPWNPDQIRVSTKQFSLRNVLDYIDDGGLELAPDFQRAKVWNRTQKSRLIESILLQIPLPAFYFAEDSDGAMRVVDGLQRLSTVHDFVRGSDKEAFSLTGLEYLEDQKGKRCKDLPPMWRRRIDKTQIVAHVIDPTTPNGVKYDIFKRINTGGTPLNAQEIRHCMSKNRSRGFLKGLVSLPEFNQATGGKLVNHVRMSDREMALRFCAFWMNHGLRGYRDYRGMEEFLDTANEHIDDPSKVSDAMLKEMKEAFRVAMVNCYTVFGEHAFRKWALDNDALKPINRPLFEAWSTALSSVAPDFVNQKRDQIVWRARDLMTTDRQFLDSITSATGTAAHVEYRFAKTQEAVEDLA